MGRHATAFAVVAAATLAACATHGQIVEQTRQVEEELERVEVATAEARAEVDRQEQAAVTAAASLAGRRGELQRTTALARLAEERAAEADRLASGRLLGEVVYVIDELHFDPGTPQLTAESRSTLDQLAERLLVEDDGYYLEVQGHADASGSEEANLRVGRERAEAVRRYLHREKGIPLHHIGVVSLGSRAPVADNRTAEGRFRNRRAVVVVVR